jgi:Trypsin
VNTRTEAPMKLRRRTLVAFAWFLLECSCCGLALGDQESDPPPNAQTESARSADAITAAKQVTDRLFAPDTPEYTAAFRHIVGAMSKATYPGATTPQVFGVLSSMRLTPFDRDPRFRASLNKSLTLSMALDLAHAFVLDSRPDTTGEFPDVVLVKGPSLQICSGIIIKSNRVLTARHCICDGVTVSVGLGAVYSNLGYKPIVDQRPPKRECKTAPTSNIDVGIVYTADGVAQSAEFPPYATSQLVDATQTALVVGYGVSIFGSAASAGDRRSASLSVVSDSCQGSGPDASGAVMSDAERFGCIPKITLVAASTTGADQCSGDSGGPLFAVDGTGKRYLAGIVSSPTTSSALHGGCGDGGIYVRLDVPEVFSWISKNL